jgi:hypothetical protein
MPSKLLHCQVSMPSVTGQLRDAVVNTISVITSPTWEPSPLTLGEVTIPIAQLFTFPPSAQQNSIGQQLSSHLSRQPAACRIKVYDVTNNLGGTNHGSPIAEDGFTLPAPLTPEQLPTEVALVARIRTADWSSQAVEAPDGADPGTAPDRPRQRVTGRLFLGPWRTVANGADGRPQIGIRQAIADAFVKQSELLVGAGHTFAVWSRANAQMRPAAVVQVDDAWDTIRGRGIAPSSTVLGNMFSIGA